MTLTQLSTLTFSTVAYNILSLSQLSLNIFYHFPKCHTLCHILSHTNCHWPNYPLIYSNTFPNDTHFTIFCHFPNCHSLCHILSIWHIFSLFHILSLPYSVIYPTVTFSFSVTFVTVTLPYSVIFQSVSLSIQVWVLNWRDFISGLRIQIYLNPI